MPDYGRVMVYWLDGSTLSFMPMSYYHYLRIPDEFLGVHDVKLLELGRSFGGSDPTQADQPKRSE